MFTFLVTDPFKTSREKVVGNDEQLQKRLKTFLQKLTMNPLHPSLKSHKVNTQNHGVRWSSRVTDDIRVIWDYAADQRLAILLLDIGGHSGTHKVYK